MHVSDIPVIEFTVILVGLGLVYLAFVWWMVNARPGYRPVWIYAAVTIGVISRLALLTTDPILEDDIYRYMLDGVATSSGFNPYAIEPDNLLSESERAGAETIKFRKLVDESKSAREVISNINYPHYRTIYPPVAQLFFASSQLIDPWGLWGWRLMVAVADLATAALLVMLLGYLSLPRTWALIYWLNPILMKEIYNSLHMDILVLPFVALALFAAFHRRSSWAMACLGVSVGIKLWPIVLVPFFLRYAWQNWGTVIRDLIVFSGVTFAVMLPIFLSNLDSSSGLVAFADHWMINDALFQIFYRSTEFLFGGDEILSQRFSKAIAFLVLGGWLAYLIMPQFKNDQDLINRSALLIFAMLILSPTQNPWYYVWALPFLVLRPLPSMLAYSALLPIYYLRFWYMEHGDPSVFDNWIVWIEHLPVYLILVWEWRRGWWSPNKIQ